MRTIDCSEIRKAVQAALVRLNREIGPDVLAALGDARRAEESPGGRVMLDRLIENAGLAARDGLPVCQDTGMVVAFAELGQDVHLTGGTLAEAVDEAVRRAYKEAGFRFSVVRDPLFERANTGDNTPAVLHIDLIPGDGFAIELMAKGFGSENTSALAMLAPAEGAEGVLRFVLETIRKAGPNPCPPVIVGVGVGGTFEKAALLSKKALLRSLGQPNPDPRYAGFERDLLQEINSLGIGPGGLGGRTTALAVHVETCPTHIASIPVAVNVSCHASRHARVVL
ncbi:MAG TPA: fumarate hydratase [Magnetospirillaceae bacterium]|nr:fumarate hydratase [Magnetospirillaceae bacterium]